MNEANAVVDALRARWAENLVTAKGEMSLASLALQAAAALPGVSISPTAIGHYLAARRTPAPDAMVAIARVLGVPGRDLFPLDLEAGA